MKSARLKAGDLTLRMEIKKEAAPFFLYRAACRQCVPQPKTGTIRDPLMCDSASNDAIV